MKYHDEEEVRVARARYFQHNKFGERGGYDERWVKLKIGPIPFWFPNTTARVRAVRLHDLHHLVTGYDTTWTGEAEIAAWEIAGGCGRHLAAWVLNLDAFAIGLGLAPRFVFQAFLRGCRTRNLYAREFEDAWLDRRVGDLRADLHLADSTPRRATPAQRFRFVFWASISLLQFLLKLTLLVGVVVLAARLFFGAWT
jgi:hypothetical protein